MAKFLAQLTEPEWWRRQMPALALTIVSLAALAGVLYLTVADVRYLITHVSQLATPGLTDAMVTRLELEIAAEVIKIFLDIYLLAVILLIFAPGLYKRFMPKRRSHDVEGVEFAAKMFLTRVENLPKWMLGVTLLRIMTGYFQKILRLDVEIGLDLLYLIIVILLVVIVLLSNRLRTAQR